MHYSGVSKRSMTSRKVFSRRPAKTKQAARVVSLRSLVRLFCVVSLMAATTILTSLYRHSTQEERIPKHDAFSIDWSVPHHQYQPSKDHHGGTADGAVDQKNNPTHHTLGNTVTMQDLGLTNVVDNDAALSLEEAARDKEHILRLLFDAGIEYVDLPILDQLPTWSTIQELYGKEPVIVGLEHCQRFRETVPESSRSLAPAGIFNSGTNILYTLLEGNCILPFHDDQYNWGIKWQVPWGKHMMASRKYVNTATKAGNVTKDHVLPVVVTRDPYTWMQSMCKHPYAVAWHHSKEHCPNLVPNQFDYRLYHFSGKNIPVRVKKWKIDETPVWPSLAHMWTDWYQQYYRVDSYPHIMIRLEDLIFFPRQVIRTICDCAGGKAMNEEKFFYMLESAKLGKGHGQNKTSLVGAMVKYRHSGNRLLGYTSEDLVLAQEALDPDLMDRFQYKKPNAIP